MCERLWRSWASKRCRREEGGESGGCSDPLLPTLCCRGARPEAEAGLEQHGVVTAIITATAFGGVRS